MKIGIIGAGAIVQAAHLPAYRSAGYPVQAIYDLEADAARKAAADFEIPHVCGSLAEVLEDPQVGVVDIAVPPQFQPEIARAAMAAGKHLLCQKPLALSYAEAGALVEEAAQAKLKLAVNQQMRWDPMIRRTKQLLTDGVLGQALNCTLEESVYTDWFQWTWIPLSDRLDLLLHSIHYFDSLRYLFGEPEWVFSAIDVYPGQKEAGETRSLTSLRFPGGVLAHVAVHHNNWAGDEFVTWRVEGTEGVVRGDFGHLRNYPHGEPDVLEYKRRNDSGWDRTAFKEKWFPDAFAGPMGSLLEAIRVCHDPPTSGRDNLKTLALVLAAYRSAQEKRAVAPEEMIR
jgi:predicted dehydrogenase